MADEDTPLEEKAVSRLSKTVHALQAGEPVQYVLENTTFYGLPFYVNHHVLIPRQETEELVHWVLQEAAPDCRLLDIGTGSGCIAVALAYNLPKARVYATDILTETLDVARYNAEKNETAVRFYKHNICEDVPAEDLPRFDVIVSNPPYVLESENKHMAGHVVNYEPPEALFVPDDDKLRYYRAIANFSRHYLQPGGAIYLEINEQLANEVCSLFEDAGFPQCTLRRDIHEKPRMVKISF